MEGLLTQALDLRLNITFNTRVVAVNQKAYGLSQKLANGQVRLVASFQLYVWAHLFDCQAPHDTYNKQSQFVAFRLKCATCYTFPDAAALLDCEPIHLLLVHLIQSGATPPHLECSRRSMSGPRQGRRVRVTSWQQ